MSSLTSPASELAPRYDVVIVGSGYGGAVAACRLARARLSVCVLERGREHRAGAFPSTPGALMASAHYAGRRVDLGTPDALYDFLPGRELHVIRGIGVGGGSLVNAAIALRPDLGELAGRGWPQQVLDDPELESDFARAEAMLGVCVPDDVVQHPRFRALQRVAAAVGSRAEALPTAISFAPRVNPSNVMQYGCRRCGDCWSGCNVGAKNTLAVTYLPDAVNHGARIFARCSVSHVSRATDGTWIIHVRRSEGEGRARIDHAVEVRASLVILAAGSIGSTEILLRSKDKGLAISERIGTGFSANGDDLAFLGDLAEPVNAVAVGHPPRATLGVIEPGPNCAGQVRVPGNEALPSLLLQDGTMSGAMARLAPINALTRLRLGAVAAMLRDGPYAGHRARTATYYVVAHDCGAGRISLEKDRVVVAWPEYADDPCHARAADVLQGLAKSLNAKWVRNPFSNPLLGGKKVTVHPLGGCGIGANASAGVVDHLGRVFDPLSQGGNGAHDGLMVCDGAVMPGSLGVNPLLTITAMAERAMRRLAVEKDWRIATGPASNAPLRDA